MRNRFTDEPESNEKLFEDETESRLDKYSKKNDEVSLKPFLSLALFLIIAVIAFWLFSQYYFVAPDVITQ